MAQPGQITLLTAGFAVIAFLFTIAQRLGDWRSKSTSVVLGIIAAALGLYWAYFVTLWVFGFNILGVFQVPFPRVSTTAATITAVLAFIGAALFKLMWPRVPGSKLEFREIHASGSRQYPATPPYSPLWMAVTNRGPEVAKNVAARMTFKNDAGTRSIPEMDCRWHQNTEKDGMVGGGWVKVLDIEPGDEQSF